jgi:hypothetical protein
MFRGVGIGGCQCLRGSAGGGQVREKKDAVNGYKYSCTDLRIVLKCNATDEISSPHHTGEANFRVDSRT